MSKKRKRTYIGVTQQFNRYRARIKINGITHNLGSYDTEKEAAGKYDTEAIKLGRTLNFETEISAVQPTRMSPRNTTGYRGVSKKYETGKLAGNKATIRAREVNINGKDKATFRARININGKNKHLGYFSSSRDAAMAFDRSIHRNNLPVHLLNFPSMKHQHLHLDEINNIKYMISQKGRMKQQRRTNENGKGVQKRKNGKYQATIRQGRNQKRKTLGTFATAKEAAFAYNQAASQMSIKT